MPTYTFTGPKVTTKRTGECPTCGKKTTRSQTFEKTVNPFNKNKETGQPKTWDEVRADVKAEAEAWAPGPELFEHDKCLAERTAPPRAKPVPVPAVRLDKAGQFRAGIASVLALADASGLPLTSVEFQMERDKVVAKTIWVPADEIVAWARALDLTEAGVDDGDWCTYVRLRAEVADVKVEFDAYVSKLSVGAQLGGAPVDWRRDRDTNRKTGYGTVAVDALAEGLAVMGIAVVDPALPPCEQTGGAA